MNATSSARRADEGVGRDGSVLLAGLMGGGLCGLADALVASLGTVGAVAKLPTLALFGLGAGAIVGLLLAILFLGGRAGAKALLGRRRPARADDAAAGSRPFLPTALATITLAAPVVIYDAFAMFAGARAGKLPGGPILPYVVLLLGLAAVAGVAFIVWRLISWTSAVVARGRLLRGALATSGVALVVALYIANRLVLPRLYPWFHATLALIIVVGSVISVRALLGDLRGDLLGPPNPPHRPVPPSHRWSVSLAIVLVAGLGLAAAAVGWVQVRRSQMHRFVIHQKSQVLSLVLQALPAGRGTRTLSPGRARSRDILPPLPDGPRRPDADIVLITIDALRPDHMGVYGYGRDTTPNLDALARRAVRFERAYTQAPNTSFAATTLLTGKYYPTLARLGPPDGLDTLPLLLRRYGFKTAAFYPPAVFYIAPDKLKAYADSNFHFEYLKEEFLPAPDRLGQIKEFFAEERPARAFLWLHLFEPHETYEKHTGHDFGNADVDRYDSEIAYVDKALGELLAYLARERPRAVVIVTADHGEEFDEHKARYHGTTLYEEQVRVPLIIAVPGVPPQVVRGPVELVDIAPTVLGLLDIPIPLRMRGNDLGPWLRNPPAPQDRFLPAFAEVNDLRMVATADEKLICDDQKGFCQLFDLRVDPHEQHNLAEARPERVIALRAEIDAWLADNAALESARGEGGKSEDRFPAALERARLGDVTVAAEVAALLTAPESRIRHEAARLLAVTLPPRPDTRAALLAASRSADSELAGWATIAAARLGDADARQRLAASLNVGAAVPSTPPTQQQIFAALAVADGGNPAAVPTLSRAVAACSDPVFCVQLINALGRLADRRATAVLIERLPTVVGRREVVMALGKIGDPAAVAPLAERLVDDEYTPVRAEAAGALAAIGGKAARTQLTRALRSEREPTVRAAITAAIASVARQTAIKP